MDNAARVVDMARTVYFFKIDHKNGYQHVPIQPIHEDSRKFFWVLFWENFLFCPTFWVEI